MIRAARVGNARVIDENVGDGAMLGAHPGDRLYPALRGEVGGKSGNQIAFGLIPDRAQCLVGQVGQEQFRAGHMELLHHVPAEAAAGTRYQDCLVRWICHITPIFV